jgi:hypothetical protein
VYGGGGAFVAAAMAALWNSPDLRDGAAVLQLVVLVGAVMVTRRIGLALPGRGFASFILAVVIFSCEGGGVASRQLRTSRWLRAFPVGCTGSPEE